MNIEDRKKKLSIVYLFNREVISFNLSGHPVFAQVVDMLKKLLKKQIIPI